MVWFVLLFAPALLAAAVVLERFEHRLLADHSRLKPPAELPSVTDLVRRRAAHRGRAA
ncbi:hypothetical protein [Pseudonocardia acaciae]|uniref:hypothetical protein n=1 Tax=Pseudonocardia acaciae TaxID=551276 RepID=UPI000AA81551|nr:hypothetical protein [Pseudonocardia acaciae]